MEEGEGQREASKKAAPKKGQDENSKELSCHRVNVFDYSPFSKKKRGGGSQLEKEKTRGSEGGIGKR